MIVAGLFLAALGFRGSECPGPGARCPTVLAHQSTGHWALGAGHSHDTHVSHTRMVLEGNTIALRVRLFHDDLTKALQRATGRPDLQITAESRADSLFGAYFATHVRLEVNGRPVRVRVTASGTEVDAAAQEVVWYVLAGGLDRPAREVLILDGLLFEVFGDQQNILQLLWLPGQERRTLYFTAADPREQRVEF